VIKYPDILLRIQYRNRGRVRIRRSSLLPDLDYLRRPAGPPPELRRSVVPCSSSLVTFASLGYPPRFALPKRPRPDYHRYGFVFPGRFGKQVCPATGKNKTPRKARGLLLPDLGMNYYWYSMYYELTATRTATLFERRV
jgi:hypothetical protein